MKKTIGYSWVLWIMLAYGQIAAQTYMFTVETADYEPIQGGQSLVDDVWDDPDLVIPIGFNFEFFTRTTNELNLRSNFSYISLVDDTEADIASLFILFGADLADRGLLDSIQQSPIRYKVSGNTGSRVLTVEWVNAGFFADLSSNGSSTDFVNFQMKLYEENGDIVYHMGPSAVSMPILAYGGNSGPFIGIAEDYDINFDIVNGEIMLLSGDPLAPDINTEYANYFLDGSIPENTVYRFSREAPSSVSPVERVKESFYYPNPTSGMIQLKEEHWDEVHSAVNVYSIYGQLIRRVETAKTIDLGDLPAGMYELQYEHQTTLRSERVFVLPE